MRLLSVSCSAALLVGFAGPALADAVTYSGTVGALPIIVELATQADGTVVAGRYAYLSKAVDIPLRGVTATDGVIRLDEEKACTEAICGSPQDGAELKAAVGVEWTLTEGDEGQRLGGTWKDLSTGKVLPLALERQGSRTVDLDAYGPLEALDPTYAVTDYSAPWVMTAEAFPYDFRKMDWPLTEGTEMFLGAAAYRLDVDPRVDLAYPTVTALGGPDIGPINAYLTQQRLQNELAAFRCLSSAYLGFGWNNTEGQGTSGFESGATITVDHLTPRLLALTESGSYWCGGPHPDNFITHRLADAKTGTPIVPETLLAGWLAIGRDDAVVDPETYNNDDQSLTYRPSEELLGYVRTKRGKFDAETEADCGIDELIATNLGLSIKGDDLVFTLKGLPHVIFACTNDLLTVPVEDAGPLLTETGAAYFAALDR